MKKLSDDLYGFTANMHERALALEAERDALLAYKNEVEGIHVIYGFLRKEFKQAHKLLDAHGVLNTPPREFQEALVERIEALLKLWESIGNFSGQCCADLKFLCNTAPEVKEAVRAYRAAHRL